jgi:hypothetical protein
MMVVTAPLLQQQQLQATAASGHVWRTAVLTRAGLHAPAGDSWLLRVAWQVTMTVM